VFDGFETTEIDTGDARIHVRRGGSGPPLLLLHGYPQTHAMWHRIAPALAEDFTVVLTDLRGYGASSKPASLPDHWSYTKRAMAGDQVAVMHALGFDRFAVCGHDRGGRVGYRMALDHPERVTRLAVLDIVPTGEVLMRADRAFGLGYWHWFFLAQPAPTPERMIGADPDAYYRHFDAGFFDPDAVAAYRRAADDPDTIRAMCEDYRAGAGLDVEHDLADKNHRRRIACPLLALWGGRWYLEDWYDVLGIWREWADDVSGRAVDAGHYLAEERPDDVLAELRAFFATTRP
jgi:haloacetate dehalogenase